MLDEKKFSLALEFKNIAHILPFIHIVVYPFIGVLSYSVLNVISILAFISVIYSSISETRLVIYHHTFYLFLFFFVYLFSYIFSPVRDIISAENINFLMGFLIFLTVFYSKGYGLKGYILWMYIALIIFLIEEIIGSSHKGNTNLMAFIFIIFSGLLLEEKRYYHAVIFFVSILITKSIAAVFSILVAALVYLFDNRKAIEWKNNAFAISVICVLCFSLFYFVDVSSLTDRFEWWKVGVRMFLERPFAGWGYSSFTYILPAFSHSSLKTLYTHNHFLSVLCEGGILAFVVWIYFIARTLTSAFGVSRYVLVAVFVDSFFDIGPDTSCGWWLVMFYIAKSLKTRSSPLIIVSIEYKKIAYGLIVIAVFFLLKFICFSYSLWKIEKTVKEIFSSSDIHSSIILADKALKNYPKSIDIAEARAYAYLKLARSNPPAIIDYLKSLEYILVLNPYRDDIYNILLKYYSKADRKVYRDIFLRKNKYIKIK